MTATQSKTRKLEWVAGKGVIVLVCLNVILLGTGIGGLVGGRKLYLEVDKHHYISDLLVMVEFDGLNLRDIQGRLISSIYAISVFCIVTSLIGASAAIFTLRVLLKTYFAALCVCIILQATIISYWISVIVEVNDDLRGHFKGLLRQYSFAINKYSLGWDYVFIYYDCCGVDPVTSTHNDFQAIPSYWWNSWLRGSDVIPNSCCKGVSIYTYLFLFNNDCTVNLKPTEYKTEGCYEYFYKLFKEIATITGVVLACVFIIEFLAIVFTIIMLLNIAYGRRLKIF